jgi:hypothetical protein
MPLNPDVVRLVQDKSFNSLPWEERKKRISAIDHSYASLPPQEQDIGLDSISKRYGAKEGMVEGAAHDLSLGFRSGAAHLANTAANAAHLIGANGASESLRAYSKKEAPAPEEMKGRDGLIQQVVQGIGAAPANIVEYAPALVAKKYAPLAAGAIGALGAADKGVYEAAKEGVDSAAGFYLQNKAAQLPTRTARAIGSAGAMALPTALTGGDAKQIAASAITGGAFGAVAKHPETPEGVKKVAKAQQGALESLRKDLRTALSPGALGEAGKKTETIVIPHAADRAMRADRADYALKVARKHFDQIPYDATNPGGISNQALQFIDHIETGNIQKIAPPLRPFAQEIRRGFDQRLKEIQEHGFLEEHFVKDYFPHLFTKPEKAEQAINQINAKRPLEGGGKFLRQRKYATVKEVMEFAKANPDFGLQLVSNNPIDVSLLQLREQDRFITARNILKEMKEQDLLKYVPQEPGSRPPEGYKLINDKFSTVMTRGVIRGHYYAPADAAQVMNNYLSPGLRDRPWFRAYLNAANSLNMFQLGWSAYHVGFTTTEAAVSQVALSIEKGIEGIKRGDPKMLRSAGKDLVKAGTVPFEPLVAPLTGFKSLAKSNKLMQEWRKPGSHPEVAPMVEAMKQAGARIDLDPHYKIDVYRNMKSAFKAWNVFKGASLALPAATERVMMPIFEYIVPMQKVGAFHRLAEFELSKLGPNASNAEVRTVLQKSWKSIDNRFGQMVYDNLFWNKLAKDVMMASVRSVGWNWGTFNEIGGGVADWMKYARDTAHGKNAELTHRMAYTMALPMVVGVAGGLTNYLATGQKPQDITDYYAPRTGKLDEFGRPERVWLPSYIKDVFNFSKRKGEGGEQYARRVAGVVKGKMHPILGEIGELMRNRDWRGGEIRNSEDPGMKQIIDSAKFVAEQVIPFTFRYSLSDRLKRSSGLGAHTPQYSLGQGAAAFVGITPAPATIKQRPYEVNEEQYARAADKRTQAQLARYDRKREMARALRLHDDAEFDRLKEEGMKRGEITEKDVADVHNTYKIPPGVARFKRLTMEQALSVYFNYVNTDKTIPAEEKEELRRLLAHKVLNKWDTIEALPDGDPRKTKARQMLKLLNMMDEQGEVTAEETEPDEETP